MPESTDCELQNPDIGPACPAAPAEVALPPSPGAGGFQPGYVLTFTFAHGVHDTYSAFMAPLLPALIAKFSLSMTEAGLLDFARTIPALLQPFVGHLGDRVNLRYLIILSPAIAATLMSLLGVAPSYALLLILALGAGLGSAGLHAVAPPVAGRFSGANLGWGMGIWMVGGSVGFAIGPVLIVAAVVPGSLLGCEGRGTWPGGRRGRSDGRRGYKGIQCAARRNRRASMPKPSEATEF